MARWPSSGTMFTNGIRAATSLLADPSFENLAAQILKQFALVIKMSGRVTVLGVTRRILIDVGPERALFKTDGNLFNIMHAEFEVEVGFKSFPPPFRCKGKFSLPARQKLLDAVRTELAKARDEAVGAIKSAQSDVEDAQSKFNGDIDSMQREVESANKAFDSAVAFLGKVNDELEATHVRVDKEVDALIKDVRGANKEWDQAVSALGDASAELRDAKKPFDDAKAHLAKVRDDVDRLCTSDRKCGINPVCHGKNGACWLVKKGAQGLISIAMLALEVPKLALEAAALLVDGAKFLVDKSRVVLVAAEYALEAGRMAAHGAIDVAKAAVSVAAIAVDNSRWTLQIAKGALEVGRGLGNGAFETANLALKGAKGLVKVGLYIAEKLAEFALSAFYIELLEFNVTLNPEQTTLRVRFKGTIFAQGIDFEFTLDFKQAWNLFTAFVKRIISTIKSAVSRRRRALDAPGNTNGTQTIPMLAPTGAEAGSSAGAGVGAGAGSGGNSTSDDDVDGIHARFMCHDCLLSIDTLFTNFASALATAEVVNSGVSTLAVDATSLADGAADDDAVRGYLEDIKCNASALDAKHNGTFFKEALEGVAADPSQVRNDPVVQAGINSTR